MALTDILVLLVIFGGTVVAAVVLGRRVMPRQRLFTAVWLSFYGVVLTVMMLAHCIEVLYRVLASRAAGNMTSAYNFRVYSLLLLGAVLIWAGVQCLRAASSLVRGSPAARQSGAHTSIAVLAIVVPLIPIQTVFATVLTVLSILSLLIVTRLPRDSELPGIGR